MEDVFLWIETNWFEHSLIELGFEIQVMNNTIKFSSDLLFLSTCDMCICKIRHIMCITSSVIIVILNYDDS